MRETVCNLDVATGASRGWCLGQACILVENHSEERFCKIHSTWHSASYQVQAKKKKMRNTKVKEAAHDDDVDGDDDDDDRGLIISLMRMIAMMVQLIIMMCITHFFMIQGCLISTILTIPTPMCAAPDFKKLASMSSFVNLEAVSCKALGRPPQRAFRNRHASECLRSVSIRYRSPRKSSPSRILHNTQLYTLPQAWTFSSVKQREIP